MVKRKINLSSPPEIFPFRLYNGLMKKPNLSKEEVSHIAKLAKLSLDPNELLIFQKQLSETLDYINVLKSLNTKKEKPTYQVTGLVNRFRDDLVKPSLSQKQALRGAGKTYKGYFLVPSVFGNNGS